MNMYMKLLVNAHINLDLACFIHFMLDNNVLKSLFMRNQYLIQIT